MDEYLGLIAKDTITEVTPLQPLEDAIGTLRNFKQTFFALPGKEAMSDAIPRAENADAIVLSCRRMFYQQQAARVQFMVLGALVLSIEKPEDPDADDGGASDETTPVHHHLFNQLEDGQIKAQTAISGCSSQATQLKSNGGYVFLPELEAELKEADSISSSCHTKIALLLKKARIASTAADAADQLTGLLQAVQSGEELGPVYTNLNEKLKTLNEHLVERIQVAGKAHADERKSDVVTVWERHAQQTRMELMQAAGVKDKLDESSALIQAKADELFKANKKSRDAAAQIAVLSQKLKVVQDEAGKAESLKASLEAIKRESTEYEEEAKKAHLDLGKYTRENQALKKKLATVTKKQLDVKRGSVAVTGAGMGVSMAYASSDSSGEVDLLARTVRSLRQQLSTAQASNSAHDFNKALPPLPSVKPVRVHPVSHHTYGENIAVTAHREQLPVDFPAAAKAEKLSKDISKVASTLLSLRSAPVLVDLASGEDSGRYGKQAARRQKLQSDVLKLNKKLTQLGKTAAQSNVGARPKLAGTPEKSSRVGQITIPLGPKASLTGIVAVGRHELQRIASAFV